MDAKRIPPSRFQVPPRLPGASQMVWGGPPEASIFLSFPSAKKPMKRLSGDQKGKEAFSVSGRGCIESESNGRIQRRFLPAGPRPTKGRFVPSGESETARNADFSGRTMEERIGPANVFTLCPGRRTAAP